MNSIPPLHEKLLFYVVGASGVGKDSLIRYARDTLGEAHDVVFAHRYITRAAAAGGENHIELTPDEFILRKRSGLFAMDWESHGFNYGVGIEIDAWLAKGLKVVVNGSRRHLPIARKRYPDLKVVWITARRELRAARLAQRGRESRPEIVERLHGDASPAMAPYGEALHIANEGPLESAGGRLVALLSDQRL